MRFFLWTIFITKGKRGAGSNFVPKKEVIILYFINDSGGSHMSVLPEERKNEILKELNRVGTVKVIDLVEQFQVSEETSSLP
jgi:hypothetical protein